MTRLLITGGAGFIGANFVRFWRDRHPSDAIVVLDRLTYAGNLANLDGVRDVAFVHGDIADPELTVSLLRDREIDTIVNFAAETHVDRSISGPGAFLQTNVIGTHVLLEAARTAWNGDWRGRRFHQVSTDEVYGSLDPAAPAFNEATPFAPNSPYAASKASADHLVRAYNRTFGLPTTISHCSNNYGPMQFPEKLIPLFVLNALEGRPMPIYGDGLNVRDWLFVDDHCQGIERILMRGREGEHYVIGGGSELTNMAVVDTLCATIDAAFSDDPGLARRYPSAPPARGRSCETLRRFVPDRLGHDRRYAIDDRRIRAELGYLPAHEFRWHFATTVRWFLDADAWWRPLRDRRADAAPPSIAAVQERSAS